MRKRELQLQIDSLISRLYKAEDRIAKLEARAFDDTPSGQAQRDLARYWQGQLGPQVKTGYYVAPSGPQTTINAPIGARGSETPYRPGDAA